MRIIIVGCGKVGYTIARHLSEEDNNVTIIDKTGTMFTKASSMDVMCLKGNGLSVETLLNAGAANADLIICVTSSDETNMLCCLTAKKLGTKYTIARVRNHDYSQELVILKQELELDMVINPELAAAMEMGNLLRFPTADDIDMFVGGRVELASFRVSEGDSFVGKSISQIFKRGNSSVLFGLIERGDDVIIPKGHSVIQEDDIIRVMGECRNVMDFFRDIGKESGRIRNVMIVGGGIISCYLIDILIKMKMKITVVEKSISTCEFLNEMYPKVVVVNGDGTDADLLLSASMEKMDSVICLTGRDEENLLLALYAVERNIPKVIAKINAINYISLIRDLGVESIICPRTITANQIIRYVRALSNSYDADIETLYKVIEDKEAEAIEFRIKDKADFCGVPLKSLKILDDVLVACIVRKTQVIIPTGNDVILRGDYVIVFSKGHTIMQIDDIFKS